MKYQLYHADLMYNLTSGLRQNEYGLSLWDIVPYVGVGMIHNADWSDPCSAVVQMAAVRSPLPMDWR